MSQVFCSLNAAKFDTNRRMMDIVSPANLNKPGYSEGKITNKEGVYEFLKLLEVKERLANYEQAMNNLSKV